MSQAFASPDAIRTAFSSAMSDMYRVEVPLYGELIDIVETINAAVLAADATLAQELDRSGDGQRLGAERHGAIRLGTADELWMMRRALAVMGMYPVGYYDLAVAGVPVHSTAFRPVDPDALKRNPFRLFTSLLRLDLIDDEDLRATAERILADRRIFSDQAVALIERAETQGGLEAGDAERFVAEILETFRWRSEALVDAGTYGRLQAAHRLVADVVSFKGPHINHLTPRVLDIDAAQAEMPRRGIDAKAVVEGPPRRAIPILLRQTSFKALEEQIRFLGQEAGRAGTHTARFGEIEQRGIALTPKGRALYDRLLDEAGPQGPDYPQRLSDAFARFPDTAEELRREELAYFRYRAADVAAPHRSGEATVQTLIDAGVLVAEPIVYEDFLPVSAAGIFQSNLGSEQQRGYVAEQAQADFERALGSAVLDPFELYEAEQDRSLEAARAALRLPSSAKTNAHDMGSTLA
jgi:uncharacterized glyoxalase superfamily metalloenzyme YdcJ